MISGSQVNQLIKLLKASPLNKITLSRAVDIANKTKQPTAWLFKLLKAMKI